MGSKIIDLFNNQQITQNKGIKYSTLLEQFIAPFVNDFTEEEYYEDILEFAINAWNFGNMKLIMPEGESDEAINAVKELDIDTDLLKRMIDYKINHFKEYTNFIADYEISETDDDHILSVITQEQDTYLATMFEDMKSEIEQDDFEENYIDRHAIIVKPLQPFLDWCSVLYPDDITDMKAIRTYLISDDIEDEEAWLKKKYNKIFEFELDAWHTNKKEWPQKRNYKMFQEWFQVDISTLIYDLERKPVFKFE